MGDTKFVLAEMEQMVHVMESNRRGGGREAVELEGLGGLVLQGLGRWWGE